MINSAAKQQTAYQTVKDGAVVFEWRLVLHFNQIVIVATFPDTTSNVRHITAAPPVVWSLHCRVNAIRISNSNQLEILEHC